MPIPKPKPDEKEDEFIQRCMADDVMVEEYPKESQRAAICHQSWEKGATMKKKEYKEIRFEIKALDEAEGIFEGYASTFSDIPDAYGDIVDKGAFAKTIKENVNRIKVLWNHNPQEPIGKLLEIAEDERGLRIKVKLSLGVQRAREVLSLMKDQVITELSIGYDTIIQKMVNGIRHLAEIRLWDVSPVTFAANPEATITAVKNVEVICPQCKEMTPVEPLDNSYKCTICNTIFKAGDFQTQELEAALADNLKAREPEQSTTAAEGELQAALDELESVLDGFDAIQAEKRIDELIKGG